MLGAGKAPPGQVRLLAVHPEQREMTGSKSMELEQRQSNAVAPPSRRDLWPDARGRFGEFGGRYVPETLMHPVEELEQAYQATRSDPKFQAELTHLLKHFAGRPTPLYHARRLTEHLGGAQIYLKREDLLHTGAHKINNCLGQGLLARRMGKTRLVAETGAGQHGVATATVAALLGLECVVYMGDEDMARQAPNVFRMASLMASLSVLLPEETPTTLAPSRRMRKTLGACRAMSSSPI